MDRRHLSWQRGPEDPPRVREVIEQILEVHQAETDMAVFDLPDLFSD
jgi:hypothetical protein